MDFPDIDVVVPDGERFEIDSQISEDLLDDEVASQATATSEEDGLIDEDLDYQNDDQGESGNRYGRGRGNFQRRGNRGDKRQYRDRGERGTPQFSNQPPTFVHEVVKQFVTYFHRHIKEKNLAEIQSMYENSFNKITEKYFKNSPWPLADMIAPLVNNDHIFLVLYKEMTYRHIYSKMIPTLEQRFDSWKNYCDLFNFILNSSNEIALEIPNQWIWDILDEFIYQYQSFSQNRSKLKNKNPDELNTLNNNPNVWNTQTVINYLQNLVAKSRIIQFLEKQGNIENSADSITNINLFKMTGYFSLIGLLRVHCLLGDYYLALKTIVPIDLSNNSISRALLTKVTACHVTFFYYLGFVYMMLRRYVDAIRTFSTILLYINRLKQYHQRSSQYEQILKKNEQMCGLLAMCLSLCPQRVDENVHTFLREKYSDKIQRMQKGDEAVYEEIFVYACPKFISPSIPNYALALQDPVKYGAATANQEPLRLQTNLFLNEVKQQSLLPTIRSYLKLYTTIGCGKLAHFLDLEEPTFKTQLLCYKHKMRGTQWIGGSTISGDLTSSSDVDFYCDKDMVHIKDPKMQRKYSEFFVRHINKFESIISDVSGH